MALTFESFLYSYLIFLFFFVFIIGQGAASYFAEGDIGDLQAPSYPEPPEETGNGLLDWLTGAVQSATYFIDNIAFFFTLMTVDSGIAWLGTLVFTPSAIFILYGLLKLLRGGG